MYDECQAQPRYFPRTRIDIKLRTTHGKDSNPHLLPFLDNKCENNQQARKNPVLEMWSRAHPSRKDHSMSSEPAYPPPPAAMNSSQHAEVSKERYIAGGVEHKGAGGDHLFITLLLFFLRTAEWRTQPEIPS